MNVRLEKNGVVVAYLAPGTVVDNVDQNSLFIYPRPRGKEPIAIDERLILPELNVSGTFMHSDGLPDAHKAALEALFVKSPVTARDQVNRLRDFLYKGGPFEFYDGTDAYNQSDPDLIDRDDGKYPEVNFKNFTTRTLPGKPQITYNLKLVPGVLPSE